MSSPEYTLRILGGVREVERDAWNGLLRDDSSPFVEHEWLDMLEQTGCVGEGTAWIPAHLAVWRADKLIALAPSYLKGNSEGEFVFDWSWADFAARSGIEYYPKIVVAVPFTPASGDRVLVAPDEDRARAVALVADAARAWCTRAGASGVHVLFPRDAEAQAWETAGFLRRDGFQYHWFRRDARTFDDYLARFTSKQRNQIKRELRGVAQAAIVVETLESQAHTEEVAQAMYSFYESTIDKHGMWGRLYLTRAFFDEVIRRYRDRLAWVVAREAASGRIVAGAFNVTRGTRLYGRYWGSAVEVPYLHFVVCYYAGIRFAIERGLEVFEPGAGGEHKRARGFVPTLTHSAHWLRDARFRRAIGPWLAHERERVRGIVATGVDDDE